MVVIFTQDVSLAVDLPQGEVFKMSFVKGQQLTQMTVTYAKDSTLCYDIRWSDGSVAKSLNKAFVKVSSLP